MPFWSRLLEILHLPPLRSARRFELDDSLMRSLQGLAEREQMPAEAMAERLLLHAIQERQLAEDSLERWRALTQREQQVVALICLGYTNREIAGRLIISPETVKSHAHHALAKFGVRNRKDLRMTLAALDFSAWDSQP